MQKKNYGRKRPWAEGRKRPWAGRGKAGFSGMFRGAKTPLLIILGERGALRSPSPPACHQPQDQHQNPSESESERERNFVTHQHRYKIGGRHAEDKTESRPACEWRQGYDGGGETARLSPAIEGRAGRAIRRGSVSRRADGFHQAPDTQSEDRAHRTLPCSHWQRLGSEKAHRGWQWSVSRPIPLSRSQWGMAAMDGSRIKIASGIIISKQEPDCSTVSNALGAISPQKRLKLGTGIFHLLPRTSTVASPTPFVPLVTADANRHQSRCIGLGWPTLGSRVWSDAKRRLKSQEVCDTAARTKSVRTNRLIGGRIYEKA